MIRDTTFIELAIDPRAHEAKGSHSVAIPPYPESTWPTSAHVNGLSDYARSIFKPFAQSIAPTQTFTHHNNLAPRALVTTTATKPLSSAHAPNLFRVAVIRRHLSRHLDDFAQLTRPTTSADLYRGASPL